MHEESGPDAELDALAAGWIAGLDGEEKRRFLALDEYERSRVRERLGAVLGVEAKLLKPSAAAIPGRLELPRLYQILRAWRADAGIAALGVADRLATARTDRLDAEDGEAKRRIREQMAALLDDGAPPRTEAVLRAVAEASEGRFSRETLLRWWRAERRRTTSGRVGETLALDFCRLDLRRSDGALHVGAFVVDRGASAVLGAALVRHVPDTSYLRAAIVDARARLHSLALDRSPVAPAVKRVAIATPADMDPVETMRFLKRLGLLRRRTRFTTDPRAYGRSVRAAAGARLGGLRLMSGATSGPADQEAQAGLDDDDAADALRAAMDRHSLLIAARQSALPAPGRDAAALMPLDEFLASMLPAR